MDSITTFIGAGSVPVILVMVQLFKNFVEDARWYAVVSILLGVIINVGIALVMLVYTPENLLNALLIGVMAGASASGLYSGGKELTAK
jgi:hypothetical protein